MLVLSRKLFEKIHIGDNIIITVVDIERGKIKLGIEAPREVPVHREELIRSRRPPQMITPKPNDKEPERAESQPAVPAEFPTPEYGGEGG